MAGSDDGVDTDLVVDPTIDFPERGRFARLTVRLSPESDAYPEGVKYSMHYGDADGRTIVRSDNAHGQTKGHERHDQDGQEEIEFPGWRELLRRFFREVMEHEQEFGN